MSFFFLEKLVFFLFFYAKFLGEQAFKMYREIHAYVILYKNDARRGGNKGTLFWQKHKKRNYRSASRPGKTREFVSE